MVNKKWEASSYVTYNTSNVGMFGVEFGVNDKLKRVYHVPYRVFCY